MRKFTKVALTLAAILASVGIVSLVIAAALGMTTEMFHRMVEEGKFAFTFKKVGYFSSETESGFAEINDSCSKLEVEFGAGTLKIYSDDVDCIQIEHENVANLEWEVDDETLHIEGGIRSESNSDGSLIITVPKEWKFGDVDLELGASKAEIEGLSTVTLNVEVGAGNAEIFDVDAKNLNAEVGVGKLSLEVVGQECDYNYSVECGIGKVAIGEHSYSGLGTEKQITNHHAGKTMDIECGIGKVRVDFKE